MSRTPLRILAALTLATALTPGATGADLAARLRALDPRALPEEKDQARQPGGMLGRDVRARLRAADDRESQAWQAIRTRADWEKYRDPRLEALRASLGEFPRPPRDLKVRVTRRLEGDGYRVENLVFESRPGVVVTANLYLPPRPTRSMPGILICHSHHNPKTQGELQDMGVLWARLGCLVLVMDQLGHGERRQHPFRSAKDYPHSFRPGRQDYYFRYNVGLQLHLAGDSLIGWMVWDLMRGVDLLRARPGVDKDRIILLGAVAGGGDPAAVTAALDRRIAAAVPFNFGGPQPETTYPLPADAEKRFHYAGSGSWESTRNLRLSARDGFLPWFIVGSVAPRGLVYAHEFAWDRARDPVWRRLEKIYVLYGTRDHLASVHGRGSVTGRPPESTHCNNVGPLHRQGIYPALKRWLGIPAPVSEPHDRRPPEELTCLTPEVLQEIRPRPVYELAAELGRERARTARGRLADLPPGQRRRRLREEWAKLLGAVAPRADVKAIPKDKQHVGDVTVERIRLEVEPGTVVPMLLLVPSRKRGGRLPVVTAFAQEGKQAFLKGRAEDLAHLLEGGAAVALPDLRGTGETRPGGERGRQSTATALASSELMLGQTLVGSRLRDLRAVLRYLRGRADLDPDRVALWGDSFAPVNRGDLNLAVPLDADRLPDQAEPLGGLLALFGALYEEGVVAVSARGGLVSYQSLLHSPFCYVPYDILIPGALTAGDLDDVAAALAPRPLRLLGLVDGLNRRVPAGELAKILGPVRAAYRGAAEHLWIEGDAPPGDSASRWLLGRLRKEGSREPAPRNTRNTRKGTAFRVFRGAGWLRKSPAAGLPARRARTPACRGRPPGMSSPAAR